MSYKLFFSKFLAPPDFLAMPAVSIEILENGIYFFMTKKEKMGIIPSKFGFLPLEPGAVKQGEIINREAVAKVLIQIKNKTGAEFVKFSIPEEKAYIFQVHLPKLKPEEIRDVLDFKIEENIPLTSKEVVFDYDIIKNSAKNMGLDVMVSATPIKFVEDLQAVFSLAGLAPTFFSPESNNLARALVKPENEQSLVIINLRESRTVFSLVISGVVYQTSLINLGGDNFTDLLAKSYNISFSEALKLKKDKLYSNNQNNPEVFSQIINPISIIKEEVDKFVVYCNEKGDLANKVDKIILCGQDAAISGLVDYLANGLDMSVEIADVWTNNFCLDDYVPEIDRFESLNYGVVNGLNLI